MDILIRPVASLAEAQAVFRLRYEVYIEELGRKQAYANHEQRLIREPLDEGALLLAAFVGERTVGTIRVNYAAKSDLRGYAALYQMDRVGSAHPQFTSVTTKLLVAPEHRKTTLGARLAQAAYSTALRAKILHDFIDVYPAKVPFFERLGYRLHLPRVVHPEFGEVIVMTLSMRDAQHLRRVRSPFASHLEAAQTSAMAAPTPQTESARSARLQETP